MLEHNGPPGLRRDRRRIRRIRRRRRRARVDDGAAPVTAGREKKRRDQRKEVSPAIKSLPPPSLRYTSTVQERRPRLHLPCRSRAFEVRLEHVVVGRLRTREHAIADSDRGLGRHPTVAHERSQTRDHHASDPPPQCLNRGCRGTTMIEHRQLVPPAVLEEFHDVRRTGGVPVDGLGDVAKAGSERRRGGR